MWLSFTGDLKVDDGVFYNPKKQYNLRVVATDLGNPPQKSEMLLRVNLPPELQQEEQISLFGSNVFKV